ELANVAHRKLKMRWTEIAAALEAIKELCPSPVPLTLATHDAALRVAVSHGYRVYDALIIAAALESECSTLYSEDLQAGQVIGGRLTIRNPFASLKTPVPSSCVPVDSILRATPRFRARLGTNSGGVGAGAGLAQEPCAPLVR